MMMARKIEALARIVLDDQPCCLEFSQAEADYFVVGTYTLQTDDDNGGDGGNNGDDDNDQGQEIKQTIRDGAHAAAARVDDDVAKTTAAAVAAEPEAETDSAAVSSSRRQRRRGSLLLFRLDNENPYGPLFRVNSFLLSPFSFLSFPSLLPIPFESRSLPPSTGEGKKGKARALFAQKC
jgi:hypothetical protein